VGKPNIGISPSTTSAQTADVNALTRNANNFMSQSNQMYETGIQGISAANQFYQAEASGSPSAIHTAIAPIEQQVNEAAAGAKQNIMQNAPAGGEKNLALEGVSAKQGADVGAAATQGYLGSFNALGQIGSQTVGLSQGAGSLGIQGTSAAGNLSSTMGSQQLETQQLQLQQKGQTLGAFTSLAGDAATMGAAGIAHGGGGGGK